VTGVGIFLLLFSFYSLNSRLCGGALRGAISDHRCGAVQRIEAGGSAPEPCEEENVKRTIRSLVTGLAVCAAGLAFAPKASAANINLTVNDANFLG
jgi:hypothetical protein